MRGRGRGRGKALRRLTVKLLVTLLYKVYDVTFTLTLSYYAKYFVFSPNCQQSIWPLKYKSH